MGVGRTLAALVAALVLVAASARAEEQTLTASDGAANDFFGIPIAISGNTLVVGATGDDVTRSNQGSARVFVRNGGSWIEQQKLTASDARANEGFGGGR